MTSGDIRQKAREAFEKFWTSTNNSNFFAYRQISITDLKTVAYESWIMATAFAESILSGGADSAQSKDAEMLLRRIVASKHPEKIIKQAADWLKRKGSANILRAADSGTPAAATPLVNLCKHCHLKIYFDKTDRNPKWRHHGSNFVECFGDLETWAEPTSENLASMLSAAPPAASDLKCSECKQPVCDHVAQRVFNLAKQAEDSGWVACADRLPNVGDDALIVSGNVQCVARLMRVENGQQWWSSIPGEYTYRFASHWRPLPPAPAKEGK